MAENILYDSSESEEEQLYSLAGIRDEDTEISEESNVETEELSVKESGRKGAKCESCVREKCPWSERSDESFESWWRENYERVRELYGRVAVFFCFLCKMFVCAECLPKHEWHEGQKVEREEGEGMEEQRERERNKEKGLGKETKGMRLKSESDRKENEGNESDRMREKTERERKRRVYIEKFFQRENETKRTEKLFSSHAVICDRVDLKHELDLDEECEISGLCGLENKRLAVCDRWNYCIKIFKLGSHVLQRYIRFVGFDSWDVTEIDLKNNSTEPNLVSGSSSDISVTDRADPDKKCLIAVTLPGERQIMFIDLSKKPAKAQKTIKTEQECYSIQFYVDKIFTVCSEGRRLDSPRYVYIYSTDGDTLNKFDTGIYGIYGYIFDPDLAVVSGRVYITDMRNNKVQCRNVEGQLISEITIEGSRPAGISVDPDNNVYVCARGHKTVYKLDADLTRYKSVLDQTTDYIENPHVLCYYRDKLFISHYRPPSLYNFVTVVRLL